MTIEKTTDTFLSELLSHLQRAKKSFYVLVSLLSLCLLAYNSASVFCAKVPFRPKTSPEPALFLSENVAAKSRRFFSISISISISISFSFSFSAKQPPFPRELKSHLPLLHKNPNFAKEIDDFYPKRWKSRNHVKYKQVNIISVSASLNTPIS